MQHSVYIHIPFCKSKCSYCDFYSITDCSDSKRFAEALIHEIDLYASESQFSDSSVSTIFFGGGTPSLMAPEEVERIVTSLDGAFAISADAEITLEANPDDLDEALIRSYLDSGINRISLGAQSFDDRDLRILGRRHDSQAVLRSVEAFENCGLINFSLDLIYGISGQTLDSWRETVLHALSCSPAHISAYCLTVEEGTPLHRDVNDGRTVLPSDTELCDMYFAVIEMLENAGLHQYELSNFAREDFESRHNLAYWTGKPYLGLGPSASSYVHPHRWTNVADVNRYIERIESGDRAVDLHEELTPDMIRSEYVMLSLRLKAGLDLEEYRRRFGEDIAVAHADMIEHFLEAGMMERADGRLWLTPKGMFVSDAIIADLV